MRIARNLFVLAAACAAAPGQGGAGRSLPPAVAVLRSCIESRAARDDYSGTILVAEKGRILWQAGFGHADADGRIPIRPETRFNIASAGKMFTAVAIGQLAGSGKLRFDDPIGRHLPGLAPEIASITVDQLLSHRSGLRDYFQPKNRAAIQAARTATDLLPIALADGVAFTPGTGQAYSNSGFVVLGAIVERLSGLAYADYVRRFIFAPAGMNSTSFDEAAPRAVPMTRLALPGPGGAAQGDAAAPGPRRAAPEIGPRRGTPAGGATSNVGDLFRFAEALRNNRLTRPEITEMLWRTHMVPAGEGRSGEKESYGYGFNRVDIGGTRLLGHGGGSPGANAQFEIYPEAARVVVALSNYDPPAATEAVRAARRAFLGSDRSAVCSAPS